MKEAKERILILLKENKGRGITLAQMHNMMIKKFGKKYDFPKLGFPKLKTFLKTIKEVYLDHGENINHIKAKLRPHKKLQKSSKEFTSSFHQKDLNQIKTELIKILSKNKSGVYLFELEKKIKYSFPLKLQG